MIDVFVNFQEMLWAAGLKCEKVVLDRESFVKLKETINYTTVKPGKEIFIDGLKITYREEE